VEQILNKVRSEENYSSNSNLYPRLMELALDRHMEKANKDECEPDKCQGYQDEMKLVISELQAILKKEEIKNTL